MKLLIVVDMQNGFIKKQKRLCEKVNRLLESNIYDKIIFTKFINKITRNKLYQAKLIWKKLTTKQEQDLAVNITGNAVIYEKYGYGLQKENLEQIKKLKIKEVDICGVEADACVYAIALQLWDVGIYPNILINHVSGDKLRLMKKVYIKQFGMVDNRK